jgi:hypothetical protein
MLNERLPIEDGRLAPYRWAAFSLSDDWLNGSRQVLRDGRAGAAIASIP